MLLLLLLLGGAAWYLITQTVEKKATIEVSERKFKLDEAEYKTLERIEIKSRQYGNSTLVRKNDSWYMDDQLLSKYAMSPVLQAITNIEIDYIPHPNALKNIVKEIGQIGIQVQLFDNNDNQMRSYYIGGGTQSERGTYYLMEGSNQPYVTRMPFFEGSTRNSFIFSKDEMRDRSIITDSEKKIVSIEVDYPREQNASFRLTDIQSSPKVQALHRLTNNTIAAANSSAVEAYIAGFTQPGAEAIENSNPKIDSIKAQLPFAIIKYEIDNGEMKEIKLFPITDILKKGEELPKLDMLVRIERYYAECSWGDFFLVQQRVIGKWLRPYEYFTQGQ